MNRNIRYLMITLLVAGAGIIIVSCSDNFLDSVPKGQLTDATFWQTEEEAYLALVGAYHQWEAAVNIVLGDAMSDNADEKVSYRPFNTRANGIMDPNTFYDWGWATPRWTQVFPYDRIRKYNTFLANIEDVPMDADEKELWKAEIRWLRAYDYFNKAMYYGDVPLVTEVIGPYDHRARDPLEEVQQFVLDELQAISGVLPVQNSLESGGRVTRGAALALKARQELFMERYADAMASAQAVIDMGVYELYPDYRELFLEAADANNREAIMELIHLPDVNPVRIGPTQAMTNMPMPGGSNGSGHFGPLWNLIVEYETSNGLPIWEDPEYDPDRPFDNRDPRLEMTVIYPGQQWDGRCYNSLDSTVDGSPNPDHFQRNSAQRTGMASKKWAEPLWDQDKDNHGNNLMVIRLAEMYLTFAEAAVETGQNTDLALDYINELRTRAGHVPATELTRELVRRERQVELAMEGLRLHDIKRWGIAMDVMPGPVYGVRTGTVDMESCEVTWDGTGDGINDLNGHILVEQRNFTERNLLFPIMQHEMDNNPLMTQNPGY